MPGPVPVYSLPWFPGIRSSTSTLLSLEFEAFQVNFFMLLIMHLALARIGYTLHLKKKKNPGHCPQGFFLLEVPPFLLPLSKSCSPFMTRLSCPSSRKFPAANLMLLFFCVFCSQEVSFCFCLPP